LDADHPKRFEGRIYREGFSPKVGGRQTENAEVRSDIEQTHSLGAMGKKVLKLQGLLRIFDLGLNRNPVCAGMTYKLPIGLNVEGSS
jgi:hypothetical protein